MFSDFEKNVYILKIADRSRRAVIMTTFVDVPLEQPWGFPNFEHFRKRILLESLRF